MPALYYTEKKKKPLNAWLILVSSFLGTASLVLFAAHVVKGLRHGITSGWEQVTVVAFSVPACS